MFHDLCVELMVASGLKVSSRKIGVGSTTVVGLCRPGSEQVQCGRGGRTSCCKHNTATERKKLVGFCDLSTPASRLTAI